jgi:hypothetical protein
MAYETIGIPISWPAAGNLSARQYYAVTSSTAGLINTGSTTATVAIGVLQDDPNALNAMGSVMQQGVSRCVCYGGDTAINPGDSLTFGTNGFAVKDNRKRRTGHRPRSGVLGRCHAGHYCCPG